MTRLQFASPAWIALMHETLRELVDAARADLAETDFTMCEVIAGVPPLGGTAVLAARITAAGVTFFDEVVDADYTVRGDYDAMVAGARLDHRTATPEDFAAQAARRKALVTAGRLASSGDFSRATKPVLRVLSRMHDRMAAATL